MGGRKNKLAGNARVRNLVGALRDRRGAVLYFHSGLSELDRRFCAASLLLGRAQTRAGVSDGVKGLLRERSEM